MTRLYFFQSRLTGSQSFATIQQTGLLKSGKDALKSTTVFWMECVVTADTLMFQHDRVVDDT